jgi:hypothetical protein
LRAATFSSAQRSPDTTGGEVNADEEEHDARENEEEEEEGEEEEEEDERDDEEEDVEEEQEEEEDTDDEEIDEDDESEAAVSNRVVGIESDEDARPDEEGDVMLRKEEEDIDDEDKGVDEDDNDDEDAEDEDEDASGLLRDRARSPPVEDCLSSLFSSKDIVSMVCPRSLTFASIAHTSLNAHAISTIRALIFAPLSFNRSAKPEDKSSFSFFSMRSNSLDVIDRKSRFGRVCRRAGSKTPWCSRVC